MNYEVKYIADNIEYTFENSTYLWQALNNQPHCRYYADKQNELLKQCIQAVDINTNTVIKYLSGVCDTKDWYKEYQELLNKFTAAEKRMDYQSKSIGLMQEDYQNLISKYRKLLRLLATRL